MTVVNPKSISGINSITMASGSDDLLTIHSNNTTERVRVNNSGDVIIGSGVTLSPDGDVFATGVCTATSFSGDGSSLTGIAATDNVRTGILDVAGVGTFRDDVNIPDKIIHLGDTNTAIRFPAADTITAETGGSERVRIDSSGRVGLGGQTSPSATIHIQDLSNDGYELKLGGNAITFNRTSLSYIDQINDTGSIVFRTTSSQTNALTIASNGNITANAGNFVIGTSGKGIDFSATSDGSGTSSSELLDDYEEGTWTPTLSYSGSGSATLSEAYGHYTKIGRMIHVIITMAVSAKGSGSGNVNIGGLPYQTGSTDGFRLNGTLTYVAGFNDLNSQVNVYRAGAGSYMEVFHMNSINPTSAITSVNINNVTNSTTIRGHAIYYVS